MIVYDGTIVTCDENNSIYRFLVEDKGKIVCIGDSLAEKYADYPRVHLGNKALLPSFTDTHIHFASYALFASTVDVRAARNNRELCDILVEYWKSKKPKFVLAFGASAHSVSEKRLVTRSEIDTALPDIPVMVIKYDGHASVNNSTMLALLPKAIASLRGYHGDSGELNQESFFAATDFITKKVSPLALLSALVKGYDRLAEKGISCIHTVEGVGFPRDLDVDLVRFAARGIRSGFQTRIFFQTFDDKKVMR
ncbi:MAG TPA: amidohydrolase family protein, partial [Spirochaetota bacterium]